MSSLWTLHKEEIMDTDRIAQAVAFAGTALVDAGAIAIRYFRRPLNIDNKLSDGGFDPVTRADREIEDFLRQQLTSAFPEFGVIGEEQGRSPGTSGIDWIIDPIDGTKSFISGLPTWGMLLGLCASDRALAGMMYQPFTGELFQGGEGEAYLVRGEQRQRLRSRQTALLADATLFCTHESMFVEPAHLAAFRRVAARARLVRFGADCYAYCMLAMGLIDLVIEDTLQPYDIVPLIPVIEGAGGVITDPQGRPPLQGGFVIAAANADLHRQALQVLALTPR
ncbi:MAG: inositol monophosphatase family protein [Desulfuromonadales bacterium]|nr:inositol monophosphatase family protein [Desulfuromonadales bacterium]